MIWIIGGTSEARTLADLLKGKRDFVVTVATYSGAEVLQDAPTVVGRMDCQAMKGFIRGNAIDLVIDMSHPYAREVTDNARAACAAEGVEYIRFARKSIKLNNCRYIESIEKCAAFLEEIKGCVFFTTGIKNIRDFEGVKGTNRYIYRVLPSIFSIRECVERGIRMEDIIAALGPFSEDMNYQMFKEYKADYVVMKDSGAEGGTVEKLNACTRLGITPVVIARQCEEKGIEEMDALIKHIFERRTK